MNGKWSKMQEYALASENVAYRLFLTPLKLNHWVMMMMKVSVTLMKVIIQHFE